MNVVALYHTTYFYLDLIVQVRKKKNGIIVIIGGKESIPVDARSGLKGGCVSVTVTTWGIVTIFLRDWGIYETDLHISHIFAHFFIPTGMASLLAVVDTFVMVKSFKKEPKFDTSIYLLVGKCRKIYSKSLFSLGWALRSRYHFSGLLLKWLLSWGSFEIQLAEKRVNGWQSWAYENANVSASSGEKP